MAACQVLSTEPAPGSSECSCKVGPGSCSSSLSGPSSWQVSFLSLLTKTLGERECHLRSAVDGTEAEQD